MVNIHLKYKNNKWVEVAKSDFFIDDYLLRKLKNVKRIQKKNWDGVIIVDGKERSGKSILGMIMAWYLSDTKMTINNFARGIEDAARKIATLPDKSVLIMDEGSTVFGSKDSATKAQKQLVKIMDVVGQKNMIFIVCLPCFFDLNKTIAVRRSLFLCHVYPDDNYNRGKFAYWGEKGKKMLYIFGKKNYDSYAFPNAEFVSNYPNFEPPFLQEYLDTVKKESLKQVLDDAVGGGESRVDVKQAVINTEQEIYYKLKENFGLTVKDMMNIKNQAERTIRQRIQAYREGVLGSSSTTGQ